MRLSPLQDRSGSQRALSLPTLALPQPTQAPTQPPVLRTSLLALRLRLLSPLQDRSWTQRALSLPTLAPPQPTQAPALALSLPTRALPQPTQVLVLAVFVRLLCCAAQSPLRSGGPW